MFDYLSARALIRTGDTIGIATGTLGGHLISLGQRLAGLSYTDITHCAIAIWIDNRLMVVEMGPAGNVLKPLSQYAQLPMVVCAPPIGTDLSLIDIGIDHVIAAHIPYSVGDLLRIGLRLLTRRIVDNRQWGRDGNGDKVCSLLPAMLYKRLSGDVSDIPPLAAPAEVIEALELRFLVNVM